MNGVQPFVYLRSCGCVFSQSGLRALLGPNLPSRDISSSEGNDGDSADKEQLDVCPQCATKFSQTSDVVTINPSKDEEERMRATMELRRSREPAKSKTKKRKAVTDVVAEEDTAVSKTKKRKAVTDAAVEEATPVSTKKKPTSAAQSPLPVPGLNPTISTASRALTNSLAAEESKRKANMSDAVKSLYRGKNDPQRKETFTTMGTFTRVSGHL